MRWALPGAVVFAMGGCATENLADARGRGAKRTFRMPFDDVYAAVLTAASARKLELVSATRESGTILLSNGISLGSLGERIAVFVSRISDRATGVEIVSRPVLAALTFPPDWPLLLFGELEEQLVVRRLKR